jgi:hypothetical protein
VVAVVVVPGPNIGEARRSSDGLLLLDAVVVTGPKTEVELTQTMVPSGFMILTKTFVPLRGVGDTLPNTCIVWEPL